MNSNVNKKSHTTTTNSLVRMPSREEDCLLTQLMQLDHTLVFLSMVLLSLKHIGSIELMSKTEKTAVEKDSGELKS